MRFAPAPDLEFTAEPASNDFVPHVGYAIGKKVGNAVVRNRIRRRLRPIVAQAAPDLAPGIYLIGVTSDDAATVPFHELRDDLLRTIDAASGRADATT